MASIPDDPDESATATDDDESDAIILREVMLAASATRGRDRGRPDGAPYIPDEILVPVLRDAEGRSRLLRLVIDSIRSEYEFVEALRVLQSKTRLLTGGTRGNPAEAADLEARAAADRKAADVGVVLEALRHIVSDSGVLANAGGDADTLLQELRQKAAAALRKLEPEQSRTTVPREKFSHWGTDLQEEIADVLGSDLLGERGAEPLATWSGWRESPWRRLRGLMPEHPSLGPKLRSWCADNLSKHEDPILLARSLLRALGVDEKDAANAVPRPRR